MRTDSAQLYFTAVFYCLHWKLTAVWNFTSVKLTTPEVMWTLIMKFLTPKRNFTPKWNLKPVWVHFGSHINVLLIISNRLRIYLNLVWYVLCIIFLIKLRVIRNTSSIINKCFRERKKRVCSTQSPKFRFCL